MGAHQHADPDRRARAVTVERIIVSNATLPRQDGIARKDVRVERHVLSCSAPAT